ncbi:MAG TPA: nucleotide sugar dehydrogenase [Bryobacteraceae bacterium]|nr:nucleotide sugar dehydrogenase [Bryobacteraceae bacterium]
MKQPNPRRIAVFGLGYVGCVTAACLAEIGHDVIGVDPDVHKVRSVNEGRAPFAEPDLDEMVSACVAAARLRAVTTAGEGLQDADIALLCVGTPSEKSGNVSLEQLQRVTADVAAFAPRLKKPLIVAVRSTIFPGTCEQVVMPALAMFPGVRVVSNPEFLREGSAVRDFRESSLVVVGGGDADAVRAVGDLYAGLGTEVSAVSLRAAEMIKYACNAFHGLKVSFANEIGSLSAALGVDPRQVMETLCRDRKLNTSAAYLKPGFAFGGSCLPKDLRAMNYRTRRLELELPVLAAILPSNQAHLERAIQAACAITAKNVGILGLSFKENTDDLRESPVIPLIENLIGKGRDVRVWDPHIRLAGIYGSNLGYLLNALPHIGERMEATLDGLLAWAGHVVVTQKLSPEAAVAVAASGVPVLDLASGPVPVPHPPAVPA